MNILIILMLIAITGCEKEDDFPLSLNYELLDSLGNPKTSFKYGEEIIFAFTITNNSDSVLYYDSILRFINEEFFKVYKISSGKKIAIGKPYNGVYCTLPLVNLPDPFLLPHQKGGVAIPWSPDDQNCCPPFCNLIINNPPLEKGEYFTGFSSDRFSFHTKNKEIEYVSDVRSFVINFKIE